VPLRRIHGLPYPPVRRSSCRILQPGFESVRHRRARGRREWLLHPQPPGRCRATPCEGASGGVSCTTRCRVWGRTGRF